MIQFRELFSGGDNALLRTSFCREEICDDFSFVHLYMYKPPDSPLRWILATRRDLSSNSPHALVIVQASSSARAALSCMQDQACKPGRQGNGLAGGLLFETARA